MTRFAAVCLAAALLGASPALATLKPGDKAPDFTAPAALGGGEFTFSLRDALKSGPVVVYFYPKAFTKGCSLEAHAFAESIDKFKALGARVIGISHDDMTTLRDFSAKDCAAKFPVASDADQHIMKAYDSILDKNPQFASRTSYVIAPDGHVIYEFTDMDYSKHVENTLAALANWKAGKK